MYIHMYYKYFYNYTFKYIQNVSYSKKTIYIKYLYFSLLIFIHKISQAFFEFITINHINNFSIRIKHAIIKTLFFF